MSTGGRKARVTTRTTSGSGLKLFASFTSSRNSAVVSLSVAPAVSESATERDSPGRMRPSEERSPSMGCVDVPTTFTPVAGPGPVLRTTN